MPRKPNRVHLLALIAVAALGCGCRERQETEKVAPPAAKQPVRIVRPSAPGSFVELVAKVEPAIVHLRAPEKVSGGPAAILPGGSPDGLPRTSRALGTGFIIDTEGHILTNHHVLGNTSDVEVVLQDGDQHEAKIVGRDPKLDVAILKIPPLPKLRPVRFGDSDNLRRGEWVLALGNPFGTEVTANAGIISSLGHLSHEAFVQPSDLNYLGFIQTDVRIDASNSGGPVTNTAGEVIAMATASSELGGAVGYAVPISRVQAIIPQLKKNGVVSRSYVGMYVDQVTAADAKKAGLDAPRGALITEVVSGGPADLAGLRPGDIILSAGGKEVSHASLPWLISTTVVGSKLELGIWRAKTAGTVVVTTAPMK